MSYYKKINVLTLAKFQAVLLAPVGMISGIIYSFGGTIYDLVTTGSVNFGTALAYVALIVQPLMFASLGFVLGIIEAVLYNLILNKFFHIEIYLKYIKRQRTDIDN